LSVLFLILIIICGFQTVVSIYLVTDCESVCMWVTLVYFFCLEDYHCG